MLRKRTSYYYYYHYYYYYYYYYGVPAKLDLVLTKYSVNHLPVGRNTRNWNLPCNRGKSYTILDNKFVFMVAKL